MASSSSSSSMDTTPPMDNTPPENLLIEGVHCLYTPPRTPAFDVVFIPGLRADAAEDHWWKTWTARGKKGEPRECWPHKWLPEKFARARVLALSYGPAAHNQEPLALWERAINCVNSMVGSNVKLGERPYFLVGHSVGGLLAKEFLLRLDTRPFDPTMVESCKGVAFYGVPHLGTSAELKPLFGVSFSSSKWKSELDQLGEKCYRRNLDFNPLASRIASYNFAETIKTKAGTRKVLVVPAAVAAFDSSASRMASITADHFDVCRPTEKTDLNFVFLVDFIEKELKNANVSYKEEVEILT